MSATKSNKVKPARKRTFDCLAFKEKVQAAIYEEIKDLSPEKQIEYYNRSAETGPLADWWRGVREASAARRQEEQPSRPASPRRKEGMGSAEGAAFQRVTIRPEQMGGTPCIRGLRIPVATVVGMVADGMTTAAILLAYPDLEEDDVREALRYAAEAVRERELPGVAG